MTIAQKSHGNRHGKTSPQALIQVGTPRCGVQIALLHVRPCFSRFAETIGPAIPRHTRVLLGERAGACRAVAQRRRMRASHFPPKALINSLPKSTRPNPKSTVDLGCEQLIRVENTLFTFILPDRRHPFSSTMTQHLRRTNGNRTATHQKIYSVCF